MEEYDGKEDRKIRYWTEAMRCVLNSAQPIFLLKSALFVISNKGTYKSNERRWVKPLPQQ